MYQLLFIVEEGGPFAESLQKDQVVRNCWPFDNNQQVHQQTHFRAVRSTT